MATERRAQCLPIHVRREHRTHFLFESELLPKTRLHVMDYFSFTIVIRLKKEEKRRKDVEMKRKKQRKFEN